MIQIMWMLNFSGSNNIVNRNRKSEHISNMENCVRIILIWSEYNYEIRQSNGISFSPHPQGVRSERNGFSHGL